MILCNSFETAKDGFEAFLTFLEDYEPMSISKVFKASYCVETDDDLRYIFVDRRFGPLFHNFDRPDEIELETFFEDIDQYYFGFGMGLQEAVGIQ